MKIGFIGLGKLGLPIALAIDAAGHEVTGYDVRKEPREYLLNREIPYKEQDADALLKAHSIRVATQLASAVRDKDIVFVCVQTPQAPGLDGSTPVPDERQDFEYGFLAQALKDIRRALGHSRALTTIAIISTVLPGTIDRLKFVLGTDDALVYNPSFCAMGTVIPDFRKPEFVLLGVGAGFGPTSPIIDLYRSIHPCPIIAMSIPSAELTKVAYNTFIGMKIVFANTMMEICHHTGADVDDVTNALGQATERLISPRYMSGGMGDGGPCHPRDNIAMSWLAGRLDLGSDFFNALIAMREYQSLWLAELVKHYHELTDIGVVILGKSYKPESALVDGSPASLLVEHLKILNVSIAEWWDPVVEGGEGPNEFYSPNVFVIATKHAQFAEQEFPAGSVILDPFGYIPDQEDVTVVRIGRKS